MQSENITLNGTSEMQNTSSVVDIINLKMTVYQDVIEWKIARDDMTTEEIIADIKKFNPDLIVDIHTDSFDGKADGTSVFSNPGGYRYAQLLYKYVGAVSPGADNRCEITDAFWFLKILIPVLGGYYPAALVELCFHDNPNEFYHYLNHFNEYAEAIIHATVDALYIPYREGELVKLIIHNGDPDKRAAEYLSDLTGLPVKHIDNLTLNEVQTASGYAVGGFPNKIIPPGFERVFGNDRYQTCIAILRKGGVKI
jgi:hypothetical protein